MEFVPQLGNFLSLTDQEVCLQIQGWELEEHEYTMQLHDLAEQELTLHHLSA